MKAAASKTPYSTLFARNLVVGSRYELISWGPFSGSGAKISLRKNRWDSGQTGSDRVPFAYYMRNSWRPFLLVKGKPPPSNCRWSKFFEIVKNWQLLTSDYLLSLHFWVKILIYLRSPMHRECSPAIGVSIRFNVKKLIFFSYASLVIIWHGW